MFEEFKETGLPYELAMITFRYLVKKEEPLHTVVYMSILDREIVKQEWKKRLPRIFANAEKYMHVGDILKPVLQSKEHVYTDDNDIVEGDKTMYTIKKNDTWKELGTSLEKKYPILKLWLSSNLSLEDFKYKYRGTLSGIDFGL